jgi:hypothetical protein
MTDTANESRDRAVTPLQTLSLLAAPIVAIVARLIWVPYDDEDLAQYIADVGKEPDRADLGAFMMVLSALLLVPAVLTLASIVRRRMPALAGTAAAMTVTGAFGMSIMCFIAIVATHLARQPDQPAMVELWTGFFNDPKGEVVFLTVLIGVVGFVALAVGLYRSTEVPKPAAVLVGLGGATTLITSGGPVRPLLVTAAVLALAGFGWVAAAERGRVEVTGGDPTRTTAPAT